MESLDNLNNLEEMKEEEEENELDIEEIEALLGLEGKSKEISELFSANPPKNFLEGISLVTNSSKFDDNSQQNQNSIINPDINDYPEIKNIIINCSNFFMAENSDKFKIVFPNPIPIKEQNEALNTNEIKTNQNSSNKTEQNANANNNNVKNSQNQNKEDKKQKQKIVLSQNKIQI